METQQTAEQQPAVATETQTTPIADHFTKVTSLSKILAAIVFITLPFVGFSVGVNLAEKNSTTTLDESIVSSPQVVNSHISDSDKAVDVGRPQALKGLMEYAVLEELPFTYQGKSGSVYLLCMNREILTNVAQAEQPFCFGDGMILMELDGSRTIVDKFQINSFEDVFSLASVAFTENQISNDVVPYSNMTETTFRRVTVSTASSTHLYIISGTLPCAKHVSEAYCISDQHISHVVSFPSLEVRKMANPKDSKMYVHHRASYGTFLWNDKGTKAIFFVPCVEGCPNRVAESYSSETGLATTVLEMHDGYYRGEFGGRLKPETVRWLSSDRVEIDGVDYTF